MNYEHFHHTNKDVFLVSMHQEKQPYFSQLMIEGGKKQLHQRKKILVICNKKWFSSWLLCQECWHIPKCSQCDVSISYHKTEDWSMFWLCCICKRIYEVISSCPTCHTKKIWFYGIGIQKAATLLREIRWFPVLEVTSQKANSLPKIQKIKSDLHAHQVVIWTSLLAHPSQDVFFDLIIFLEADKGLQIPDFTATEQTFRFLYETIQKHPTKNIIVQSYNTDHYAIRAACSLAKESFREQENTVRKTHNYPPFAELCIILYKHETEKHLHTKISAVYQELLFLQQKYDATHIEIHTTPPLVYKMFGKYRYNIICKGKNLRQFMDIVIPKLNLLKRGFKVDRDAQSIV